MTGLILAVLMHVTYSPPRLREHYGAHADHGQFCMEIWHEIRDYRRDRCG